jgi:hypothetical protein
MNKKTEISPELLKAYENTDFKIFGECPFTLRVNQRSAPLLRIYEKLGVETAAFLTAWNPRSEPTSQAVNQGSQMKLEKKLSKAGHSLIKGVGIDPKEEWPGEDSVLALGISQDDAISFGREFGQNAIVLVGPDGIARLLVLN